MLTVWSTTSSPDSGEPAVSPREDTVPLGGKVAAVTILALALLLGAAWLALYLYAGDRAPRSARVEGVKIAGLAPAAAEEKLRNALAGRAHEPITVSYGDGRVRSVDPAQAGLDIDYQASVVAAGGGHGWSPQRLWDVVTGSGDHDAVVTVDERRMQDALDSLGEGISQPPVDGSIAFHDGRALGVAGRAGLVIDRSGARALLMSRYLHAGSQKLPMRIQQPVVTADEVNRTLGTFGRQAMSGPVTIVLGGQRIVAPPRLFGRALSVEVQDGHLVPQVDAGVLMDVLAPVATTVGAEPEDARIVLKDGKPVVVPARVGVAADNDALERGFAQALVRHGAGRRVVVPGHVRQPAFTTAEAQRLGVHRLVSTFTASFPYATYRNVNLARSAHLVDGTLLRPGETFSLNSALGERTRANGFTEGNVVADGVSGKDVGGGVTPLATAMFNAMFFAGLKDVEHTAAAVHSAAMPVGREATVVWPSADLRFTDDSPDGVLLGVRVQQATPRHNGSVTVSMWSTKRWDVTALTGPRTDVRQPAVRYVQTGSCQRATGSPGFGVDVVRVFRRPGAGKVVRRETFHTDYRPGETVRCGRPRKPRPS
jgi:vancomycin resistance protein YoaR